MSSKVRKGAYPAEAVQGAEWPLLGRQRPWNVGPKHRNGPLVCARVRLSVFRDGEAEGLVRKAVEMAYAGHALALRLLRVGAWAWSRNRPDGLSPAAAGPPLDPSLERRVDEELARYDG